MINFNGLSNLNLKFSQITFLSYPFEQLGQSIINIKFQQIAGKQKLTEAILCEISTIKIVGTLQN